MKIKVLRLFIFFLNFEIHSSNAQEENPQFRPFFNPNDLEGWVPVNVAPSTFEMEDGVLKCTGKPIGEIRTAKMYQNFILEIEWRHLVPRGNAGIFVWADDLTARGQPFHRGIEIQVLENAYGDSKGHTTHGDIFPIHGATMNPINGRGGGRAFPTESRSKPSPEWNHYRIEAIDGRISLAVNGKVVTRGENCNPRKGYLCIESEGGVVEYRNARIAELPGGDVPAEDTAIKNRGYETLYTGVDFSGWKAAEGWKSQDWQITFDGSDPLAELSTTTTRNDFGFVFDVKTGENSGIPQIFLRGKGGPTIAIDRTLYGDLLEDIGKWNRVEGEVKGGALLAKINGKPIHEAPKTSAGEVSGPMIIVPDGPVQFANIFVRDLK